MGQTTDSRPNPIKRFFANPVWDGISGLLAIAAFILSLRGLWELITGNVRLLLWLQATTYAIPTLVVILFIIFLGAAYTFQRTRRESRHPARTRPIALAVMVATIALTLIITVGYNRWVSTPSQQTLVLIADFLDPNGQDSRAITREIVTQIGDTLADYADIQVRTLGWPIENHRGEGSADARRIGQLAKADIIIWGDYLNDSDRTTYVHFDLLNTPQPLLETESYRVYGNDQVQQAAVAQQPSLPDAAAFNVALGDHLGTLVAFAGGITLLNSGAYIESVHLLDIASEIYGNPLATQIEPVVHFMRGIAYSHLGNKNVPLVEFTEALKTLTSSSLQDDSTLTASMILTNRGSARADQGDLAGAISDYDQAIAIDPQFAAAYTNRGLARRAQGDLAGAISSYDQAIAIDPQNAAAYTNRGFAHHALGDLTGALRDYDQAIAIDPQNAAAYTNHGLARYALGDLTGALRDYDQAIAIDPQNAAAYTNRGLARYTLGDLAGAISSYDQAIAIDPQFAAAYTNRGIAHYALGDPAGATSDYNQALAIDPQDATAYTNRGNARKSQGNLAGAISDYDQAIAIDPQNAGAYYNRGNAHKSQGNLAEAISDYDQAIAIDPQYALAYYNRGNARGDQGDLVGAINDYNRAIALNPQNVGAYGNRGNARRDQGDLAGAISDYGQVLALNPQDATAYTNRGLARHTLGDLAGAISDYDQAVAIDPQLAAAYINRGLARADQGDMAGAISDYNQALVIDPQFAAAYTNRGYARADQGDQSGAIADLTRYLELAPTAPNRTTIEQKIAELTTQLNAKQ